MAKEDLKLKDELDLRLRDAELTKAMIEAKKDQGSPEAKAAKDELREFREHWRKIREWQKAVQMAEDPPPGSAEASPGSVKAGVKVGGK